MFNVVKNLAVNLVGAGTSPLMLTLIVGIISIGLWGEGELAAQALDMLKTALFPVYIITLIAQRS